MKYFMFHWPLLEGILSVLNVNVSVKKPLFENELLAKK